MSAEATFGSWLKNRRKDLDLTQDELARRVDCSLMLIRKIEADDRRPSKQIAELLAEHLDIPPDECADFVRFARAKNAHYSLAEKSPWRAWRHHLSNLPVPPTPLFGRKQDIDTIVRRIVRERVSLLSLVGPPGIGKTRLAIACAEKLLDQFDDGVYYIALASVRDPDQIASTINRVLGVNVTSGQSLLEGLIHHLAGKHLLLILDNFEQVVAAAPLVAELLTNSPWIRVLVTSRVSLHVRAERQFRVAPLALPAQDSIDDPNRLGESPAVQLFLDRARSVQPDFELSPQNAGTIAQLCARLEGLPLAIELIATRANALSPSELLAQMERRLTHLTDGPRDLPARHQTLRDAIAWSYCLLDTEEEQLFARLSVFVGGCTTQTAEQVCGGARLLARLVDKSLLTREHQRYAMLETLREFALERLMETGQLQEMVKRHAQFFCEFAESAAPHLMGAEQNTWLNRLGREQDNLHAALQWAIDRGEAEWAVRLCVALWHFWYKEGWLDLGCVWIENALALADVGILSQRLRLNALHAASYLHWSHADHARAESRAEEHLALATTLGDPRAVADANHVLANVAIDRMDYARAIALHTENLTLRRELGDRAGIASSLNNLGRIAHNRGHAPQAIALYRESLDLHRKLGDNFGIAVALNNLGSAMADNLQDLDDATSLLEESLTLSRGPDSKFFLVPYTLAHLGRIALYAGQYVKAQTLLDESLSVARDGESKTGIAFALLLLAQLALNRKDHGRAGLFLRESLILQREFEDKGTAIRCLDVMAALFFAQGKSEQAVILLASAEELCKIAQICLPPAYCRQHDATASLVRTELDEKTWRAAWERGRAMTMNQAFDFALGTVDY